MRIHQLRRRVAGLPLYVWLIWLVAVVLFASVPALLSDPAMWTWVADPELLALVMIVGARYGLMQVGFVRLQVRGRIQHAYAVVRSRP